MVNQWWYDAVLRRERRSPDGLRRCAIARGRSASEQLGHVAADAVADENPLHDRVLAIGRQRIRRDLPAAHAHAVGQVVEREAGAGRILQRVGHRRQAAVAVVEHVERAHRGDFLGEELRRVDARLLDLRDSPRGPAG